MPVLLCPSWTTSEIKHVQGYNHLLSDSLVTAINTVRSIVNWVTLWSRHLGVQVPMAILQNSIIVGGRVYFSIFLPHSWNIQGGSLCPELSAWRLQSLHALAVLLVWIKRQSKWNKKIKHLCTTNLQTLHDAANFLKLEIYEHDQIMSI